MAMAPLEVKVRWTPAGVAKLNKAVAGSGALLKKFGALVVSDSQLAFQNQSFGGVMWPEKYPNQGPPFISTAGLVQDFAEGRNEPSSTTLKRTPALQRTSDLRNGISAQPLGPLSIEVGSPLPYATIQQQGGISTQPVTQDMKDRIEKWLETWKRTKVFAPAHISQAAFNAWAQSQGYRVPKKSMKRSPSGNEVVEQPNPFAKKLAFLLKPSFTELVTQVNARPFIGLLEQTAADFAVVIAEHVVKYGGT